MARDDYYNSGSRGPQRGPQSYNDPQGQQGTSRGSDQPSWYTQGGGGYGQGQGWQGGSGQGGYGQSYGQGYGQRRQ